MSPKGVYRRPKSVVTLPTFTHFGNLLRESRQASGMTLRDVADKGPFTYSHLCRIERGQRRPPQRSMVVALAESLNIDADRLLEAAGYAPVGGEATPKMFVGPGSTGEERRWIERANSLGVYVKSMTTTAFWEKSPEDRRRVFRYLDGVIEESAALMEVK